MPNRSALRIASHEPSGNSSLSSQWRAFGSRSRCGDLARERTERLLVLCLRERVGPEARHGCEASEQPSASRAGPRAAGSARAVIGRPDYRVRERVEIVKGKATAVTDVAPKFDYPEMDFETAQPYPVWARAREECPVVPTRGSMGMEGTSYQITLWDDVEHVLRDGETFSSSINAVHIGQYMGDLILAMDGKEHRSYRNLVAHGVPGVAARPVGRDARSDRRSTRSSTRSRRSVAPISSATSRPGTRCASICGIVGVPVEDSAQFHQWAEQINTGPTAPRGRDGTRHARCASTSNHWSPTGVSTTAAIC